MIVYRMNLLLNLDKMFTIFVDDVQKSVQTYTMCVQFEHVVFWYSENAAIYLMKQQLTLLKYICKHFVKS